MNFHYVKITAADVMTIFGYFKICRDFVNGLVDVKFHMKSDNPDFLDVYVDRVKSILWRYFDPGMITKKSILDFVSDLDYQFLVDTSAAYSEKICLLSCHNVCDMYMFELYHKITAGQMYLATSMLVFDLKFDNMQIHSKVDKDILYLFAVQLYGLKQIENSAILLHSHSAHALGNDYFYSLSNSSISSMLQESGTKYCNIANSDSVSKWIDSLYTKYNCTQIFGIGPVRDIVCVAMSDI